MEVRPQFDVIVAGAGPAGSAAAIAAADRGLHVLLLESTRFPRHKVCGEFVSAESAEVLQYLLGPASNGLLDAPKIRAARLHAEGHSVEVGIEPAAYSIPRFVLDQVLWRAAQDHGVECHNETVQDVGRTREGFLVRSAGSEYHSTAVINASGRWSRLSRRVSGTSWIGLKAHFQGATDDFVDLYFGKGAYCGVQAIAPGVLNACALVQQGVARDLAEVFEMDPHLRMRSSKWTPVTEVFATAPVYLGPGEPVVNGMLQAGDAAGFVDPFVGDGISLALRSGVLAGRSVLAVSAERYSELYRRSFAAIFRNTGRVRSLLNVATPLRPALIHAFRLPMVGRRIFASTRRSCLDVIETAIA